MVRFPGIESNFLVGVKSGEFLESVLEEYKRLTLSQKYLYSMMAAFDLKMGMVSQHDRLSRAFTIAAHIVLQVKQFEISKSFPDSSKVNRFAVDEYGVFTINQRYYCQHAGISLIRSPTSSRISLTKRSTATSPTTGWTSSSRPPVPYATSVT